MVSPDEIQVFYYFCGVISKEKKKPTQKYFSINK